MRYTRVDEYKVKITKPNTVKTKEKTLAIKLLHVIVVLSCSCHFKSVCYWSSSCFPGRKQILHSILYLGKSCVYIHLYLPTLSKDVKNLEEVATYLSSSLMN